MTEERTPYGTAPARMLKKKRRTQLDKAESDFLWHEFRKCTCRPNTEEGARGDACVIVMRSIRSRMEVIYDLIKIADPEFELDKAVASRFKLLP